MLMYHGTVSAYLPSIQKHGLKPSKRNAWRVKWPSGDNLRDFEKVDSVYLTPNKYRAMQYAETKAKYLSAEQGTEFAMYGQPGMELTKEPDAPTIQTEPVLLTVDIDPQKYKGTMHLDPSDRSGIKYPGTIPPSAIKSIKPLPMLY